MQLIEELAPCPICQSHEGLTLSEAHAAGLHWWNIECHGCCIIQSGQTERDLAIAAWNTRTLTEREAALLGVLGEVREALRPFARYADGIGKFGGPFSPFHLSFCSSAVGDREVTEADFAKAKDALAKLEGIYHE